MVVLKNAIRLNGVDGMVITKLDVLGGLKELKICTAYESGGKIYKTFPACIKTWRTASLYAKLFLAGVIQIFHQQKHMKSFLKTLKNTLRELKNSAVFPLI